MRKERNPPQEQPEISVKISGNLAVHIAEGARKSGLTPKQYVLSLLWHNVPLAQKSTDGLPDCVQLVLHDIRDYYCSTQDPSDDALLPAYDKENEWECMADNYNPEDLPF